MIDCVYPFHFNDTSKRTEAIIRLQFSLTSIKDQSIRPCIMNNSNIDIEEDLKEFNIKYKHIPLDIKPYSRSMSINLGVKELVQSDFFLVSDIDLIYHPEFYSVVNEYMTHNEKVRVVFVNRNLGTDFFSSDYFECEEKFKDHKDINRTPEGPSGGNGLIYRECFDKIGGYNEEFIGYGPEDAEFNERISEVCNLIYDDNPIGITYHLHHAPSWR